LRNIYCMNILAKPVLDFVKNYLIEELGNKLKNGIDPLFDEITSTLKKNPVFQTILKPICHSGYIDDVKKELITQTQKDEFYVELKEKIPDITDDMIVKLKEKLEILINVVITCEGTPSPVAAAGGSNKKRRQRKTKKRIHKRSRGRKQHSRK